MYGNGYSMAIVLDHRSTATSLTGNHQNIIFCKLCYSTELILDSAVFLFAIYPQISCDKEFGKKACGVREAWNTSRELSSPFSDLRTRIQTNHWITTSTCWNYQLCWIKYSLVNSV